MTKARYERRYINYTPEHLKGIAEQVDELMRTSSLLSSEECKVWEVLRRYEGEMGLSVHQINYLGSAIMQAMEEEND